MLYPLITHPVGSCTAQSLKSGKILAMWKWKQQNSQHCWANNVGSCLLRPFARSFIAWPVSCGPQSHPSILESTAYLLWLVEASLHTMVVQSVSNYPIAKRNLEFYQAKKYYFLSVTYRSVTVFNKAYMCPLIPLVIYTQKKRTCILVTYPYAKLIITFKHS